VVKKEIFLLPQSLPLDEFLEKMTPVYSFQKEPALTENQTFYDTFDWRLFQNRLTLIQNDSEFRLCKLSDEQVIRKLRWTSTTTPRFWSDFPAGAFQTKLQALLTVRAIIKLVTVVRQIQPVNILNTDQKIVLKVHFETIRLKNDSENGEIAQLAKVQPLRGYQIELEAFKKFGQNAGWTVNTEPIFITVLRATGKEPGAYSSKLQIPLKPEMSAKEATITVLKHLHSVIRQNEDGIKHDIDTEFLHDFRVAIRRTRSALSQMKAIFPKEIIRQYKQNFAYLGQLTNHSRDLDVYLLKQDQYRNMLPDHLKVGLDPLFKALKNERKAEYKKLVEALFGTTYQQMMQSWQDFLNSPSPSLSEELKNADKPILAVAQKFIYKRFLKVIKIGNQIDPDTPDKELHQLRINCKKLRYLIEFFASLFPSNKIGLMIKQLKMLQDNLGDYNDFHVQQEKLLTFMENNIRSEKDFVKVSAAIGGLITQLNQRQLEIRQQFEQTFSEFSKPKNVKIFQELFG